MFAYILSIKIEIQAGKESAVDFSTGQEPAVYKAKNGHLMVVSLVMTTNMLPAVLFDTLNFVSRGRHTT